MIGYIKGALDEYQGLLWVDNEGVMIGYMKGALDEYHGLLWVDNEGEWW